MNGYETYYSLLGVKYSVYGDVEIRIEPQQCSVVANF
jgi:hypothetical protein